ncbi:hypothetical protein Tco_1509192 [Tanacetum coccineum]
MQKNLALIAKYFKKIYKPTKNNLRTSSNSKNKDMDPFTRTRNDLQTGQFGNQRTEYGHFAKECKKQKRVKDYAYYKEKMMLCKQEEKGVPLSTEQSDWIQETDEEPDEQELEARYINVIPDHSDMCNTKFEDDQNADVNDEGERVELANLIANLKRDIDENKKIQKQLRKANATLMHELNESKYALSKSNDI